MTNNKDLKIVEQIKTQPLVPQTQEVRYMEVEDLYPDLGYEDIGSSRGYGPCKWNNPNCPCSPAELEKQAAELKVQREREALEYERKQREEAERKRQEDSAYIQEQKQKWPWERDRNWRNGDQSNKWPWQRDPNWRSGPTK